MTQENKKSGIRKGFFSFLVLAVFLGFLAGIGGEFFTRYYLSNLAFFRDLYFTDPANLGQRDIVIRDPRKVVIEQDLRIDQIKNETQPKLVGIYKKKKSAGNLLDKIFLPEDYQGQAVVLTSDGWLLTTNNITAQLKDSLVVSHNKKIYEIDKIVVDEASKITFLKITAQNLPVVKLADYSKIIVGQQVIIYNNYSDQVNLAGIKSKAYKEMKSKTGFVESSQIFDRKILLNRDFTADYKGAALMDFQGEIVGLFYSQNEAIPLHYINPIISQVLKGEKISRPYLGINYLDISNINGLSEEDRQGAETGALIWPNEKGIAVYNDSPLVGKLVSGDIIISIEGQRLDRNNDLKTILFQYKSGQKITLKYLHQKEENELNIVLP